MLPHYSPILFILFKQFIPFTPFINFPFLVLWPLKPAKSPKCALPPKPAKPFNLNYNFLRRFLPQSTSSISHQFSTPLIGFQLF